MDEVVVSANNSVGAVGAYTVESFAAAHGIGRTMAFAEIKAGRLRCKKAGRRTIITPADAKAWLDGLPDGRDAA